MRGGDRYFDFYASNCGYTAIDRSIKPSPVGEGGSTERLAEVETDEVFVTQTNFASILEGGGTSLASDGGSYGTKSKDVLR